MPHLKWQPEQVRAMEGVKKVGLGEPCLELEVGRKECEWRQEEWEVL